MHERRLAEPVEVLPDAPGVEGRASKAPDLEVPAVLVSVQRRGSSLQRVVEVSDLLVCVVCLGALVHPEDRRYPREAPGHDDGLRVDAGSYGVQSREGPVDCKTRAPSRS